jgi:hypothetical protein
MSLMPRRVTTTNQVSIDRGHGGRQSRHGCPVCVGVLLAVSVGDPGHDLRPGNRIGSLSGGAGPYDLSKDNPLMESAAITSRCGSAFDPKWAAGAHLRVRVRLRRSGEWDTAIVIASVAWGTMTEQQMNAMALWCSY